MSERFIYVNRWPEFQHYKSQERPKWIKSYTRLLHDDNYRRLTHHQRGVLHGIWLLYASSGRQLSASTASLTRQLNDRVSSVQLKALSRAGFIRICSRATLEKLYAREEVERDKPKAVTEARSENNGLGFEIDKSLKEALRR